MLYWGSFLLISLNLAYIQDIKLDRHTKRFFFLTLLVFVVLYSGYRGGLGADYEGYITLINSVYKEDLSFIEPAFTIIANMYRNGVISESVFFLIYAIIINFFLLRSYRKLSLSFIIAFSTYVFMAALYFNTFNLIRQFAAAAVFLSLVTRQTELSFLRYILYCGIASIFHASAIYLIPFYLIFRVRLGVHLYIIWAISIILPYVADASAWLSIMEKLSLREYSHYFSASRPAYSSGVITILLNIILLYLTIFKWFNRSKVTNHLYLLFFCAVILVNLTPMFYFFYRFSIYFLVVTPIVVSWLETMQHGVFIRNSILSALGFGFIMFLLNNANNTNVVPSNFFGL